MSSEIVTLAWDGDIAVITVNNPPVNTINKPVREAMMAAMTAIDARPNAKAVVLVCEGSTFFSGADIGEFSGPPQEAAYREMFGRLERLPVPVVVGMHGTVMGGGLEIALAGHYRVAVPGTRFGLPEVTLGIIPGAGGTQRMPRLIGVERTLEFVIGARPVDVATGIQWGFLDAARRRRNQERHDWPCEVPGRRRQGSAAHVGAHGRSGQRDSRDSRKGARAGTQAIPEPPGGADRHRGDRGVRDQAVRGRSAL